MQLTKHNHIQGANRAAYIVGLYKSGKPMSEISTMFDLSKQSVRNTLLKNGVKPRKTGRKIHTLNESYFDHITDSRTAYNLGVLLSGSVSKTKAHGNTIIIVLHESKRHILESFAADVGSSRPIYKFKNRNRVSLNINSARWVAALSRLGFNEYKAGDKTALLANIDSKLHKFVNAGIASVSE